MKKILLFVTILTGLIFYTNSTFSQSQNANQTKILIDGNDINSADSINFIQLMFTQKFLSFKVRCVVDCGREIQFGSDTRVQNSNGTKKDFNTVIDGLNFFTNNGWDFVTTYPVSTGQGGSVYHFLLKRHK